VFHALQFEEKQLNFTMQINPVRRSPLEVLQFNEKALYGALGLPGFLEEVLGGCIRGVISNPPLLLRLR